MATDLVEQRSEGGRLILVGGRDSSDSGRDWRFSSRSALLTLDVGTHVHP